MGLAGGQKTTVVNVAPITSYQGHIPSAWRFIVDANLDRVAEVVTVSFFHCKNHSPPTPLLSYCILRKEVTQYSQPMLKEWGVRLHFLKGRVSNINDVKFFCLGDLSSFPHLFMCATIDLCQYWLMLSIVLRVCSFFVARVLALAPIGSSFRLTPVSLSLLPSCVCVCSLPYILVLQDVPASLCLFLDLV